MPKRSLHPGKGEPQKIEQLNQALDVMLARADGKLGKIEAGLAPLVRVAADLRQLPREAFKKKLKSELLEGRRPMTTVAEPVAAVHTTAM
ncbi:MAG: hypothetical protein WCA16_03670, partial [Candidatus Sulfotelmatobacter sp.]